MIGFDMHPRYVISRFAQELSQKKIVKLVEVQHHYARLSASMVEMVAQANRDQEFHIIGASCGVVMNVKITYDIAVHVKNHGLRAIRHRKVLLEDAGISMGRAGSASFIRDV